MKKFGFGLMRLPLLDQADTKSVDIETVKKMADAFLAAGFSYFDTAACYHDGQSEIAFRWSAGAARRRLHRLLLATRAGSIVLQKGRSLWCL